LSSFASPHSHASDLSDITGRIWCRAQPILSEHAKFSRVVEETVTDSWRYELPVGGNVTLGAHSQTRVGVTTLLGTANAELGGHALVYLTTAHRVAALDASEDATEADRVARSDSVIRKVFPHMVAWLRRCINRNVSAGVCLGAGAVAVRHDDQKDSCLLFGKSHRKQQPQAFSSLNTASLVALDRSVKDQAAMESFVAEVCSQQSSEPLSALSQDEQAHLLHAMEKMRVIVVAHNNRRGVDPEGGIEVPLAQQLPSRGALPRPLPMLARARERINHVISRMLRSLFSDTNDAFPVRGLSTVLQGTHQHVQVWASIGVEFSVCEPRGADDVGWCAACAPIYTSPTELERLRGGAFEFLGGDHPYRLHFAAEAASQLQQFTSQQGQRTTLWPTWCVFMC
jgi:hypothetical protein